MMQDSSVCGGRKTGWWWVRGHRLDKAGTRYLQQLCPFLLTSNPKWPRRPSTRQALTYIPAMMTMKSHSLSLRSTHDHDASIFNLLPYYARAVAVLRLEHSKGSPGQARP